MRVRWSLDSPVLFRRLPNLKKPTLTSSPNNRTTVIRTVAGLIGWNQPELTSLVIVDTGYGGYAPTLQDFLAETSSSVCLKITHLHLNGLLVKFDGSELRHLRSWILLTIVNILSPCDNIRVPKFRQKKFGQLCDERKYIYKNLSLAMSSLLWSNT